MSNTTPNPTLDDTAWGDLEPITAETITLSEATIAEAAQAAQTLTNPEDQWSAFLQALALAGFDQWLGAGPGHPTIERIEYDQRRSPAQGVNRVVNHHRLCIVALGSLGEDRVTLPSAALWGDQAAHVYLLLEVQEEANQVRVVAGLGQEQLRAHWSAGPPINAPTHDIPLTWFTLTPEQVLLYLSCLKPAATLTPAPAGVSATPARMITGLMNVGRWLQDQLDEVATQWAWVLLPPLSPAPLLRSATEELEKIASALTKQGVTLPLGVRSAYTDLQLADFSLRLYALVWPWGTPEASEWSLLVCLGPTPDQTLPAGITLRVGDGDQPIVEQSLAPQAEATFLYGQVLGAWSEQFWVEISLPDGPLLRLPPFGFQPGKERIMVGQDLQKITIPLDRVSFESADQLSSQQPTLEQGRRVYLNTLAVGAVHTYLGWLGIRSEPCWGDSGHASLAAVMDGADLVVPGIGRLECRPVLPGMASFTIPLEVSFDRIGYVAVQFHNSLEFVDLIGFLEPFPEDDPALEPPLVYLHDLLPVEALLNVLHPISRLRQWLDSSFDAAPWQPTASLLPTRSTTLPLPSADQRVSRGKIIALSQQSVILALEVIATAEASQSLGVRVQLYPHREANPLPRQLHIAILDQEGVVLSEATTGDEELFIQLELLGCLPGEQFSVCLTLQGTSTIEEFMV